MHFPRADIHELLTPDLLHQVIKGTFKDHLVEWVLEYIKLTAPSEREANRIIDDIDRRCASSTIIYQVTHALTHYAGFPEFLVSPGFVVFLKVVTSNSGQVMIQRH